MRRLLPLTCALLVTACGGEGGVDPPFTDSRIPPELEQGFWPPETWAWGLIRIREAPPLRYGVAGPPGGRNGDVLILTGFGESAEGWFETVRALNARGYVVWVLEGAGQGGSGREARPRDLVHASDLAVEADAVRAMAALIGRPAVLVAQSTAVPAALSALAAGADFPAAVLSAPALDSAGAPVRAEGAKAAAPAFAKARLGWLRASGQRPWQGVDTPPLGRAGVLARWRQANPDLRTGGASWGWIAAFDARSAAIGPAVLARIRIPVLVLTPGETPAKDGRALCAALPRCERRQIAGGRGSLHLEAEPVYRAWTSALEAAVAAAFDPPRGP